MKEFSGSPGHKNYRVYTIQMSYDFPEKELCTRESGSKGYSKGHSHHKQRESCAVNNFNMVTVESV
jgi:hypothetical protein